MSWRAMETVEAALPRPPPWKTLWVFHSSHRSHSVYDDAKTMQPKQQTGPPDCHPCTRSKLSPICPAAQGAPPRRREGACPRPSPTY